MYVPANMHADFKAVHRISAALVGHGVMRVSWGMVVNQAMVHLGGPYSVLLQQSQARK